MPGIEPRSSVRAASAPNHLAISPSSLQPQWALFSNETFSYYLFTSLLQQVLQDKGWEMCGTTSHQVTFVCTFSYKPRWFLWYSQGLSFKQYIICHLSGGSSPSKWRPLSLYCNYICFYIYYCIACVYLFIYHLLLILYQISLGPPWIKKFMRTVPSLTPLSFWRWLGLYSKCWRVSMCTNFPTKNKSQ